MAKHTVYERWDGSVWQQYYFKTNADIIEESSTKKVMTAAERTAISDYLATFNAANKLLKLDASALIPVALIPDISATYLLKANPSFTGNLTGAAASKVYGPLGVGFNATNLIMPNGATDGFIFKFGNVDILEFSQLAHFDFKGYRMTNIADPIDPQDAVPKSWVEELVSVGAHPAAGGPVQAASTGNYATFPSTGPVVIDGVSFLASDLTTIRVLVKNQSTASQNGIYIVNRESGNVVTWNKVTADSTQGNLVFVEYGATQNDWLYHNSNGTSWAPFSKVDTVVGDEVSITKSGQTFSIKAGGVSNAMLGGSIASSKLASEASAEATAYASMVAAGTATPLATRISDILSAIKLLRGVANFKTDNTETINDAYVRINRLVPQDGGCRAKALMTTNVASLSGPQTIDGVSCVAGDIVVLVGQTTAADNGVYMIAAGVWVKLDTLLVNCFYVANQGTANANKVYRGTSTTAATLLYNGSANIPVGLGIFSYV
ncbi:MAG: hypothetical protein A2Y16_05350 [Tenericutes bacterium GWF2_57_13]|nr:MAG: hypothetical protein A2Y16_05350 [Tenericutes bacterium GWF2_57_13]